MFQFSLARQAAERCQLLPLQRERAFLEPVVGVEEDELGPRQPAHLPQYVLRQRKGGLGEGGDHAGEVVLLPPIGRPDAQPALVPLAATIASRTTDRTGNKSWICMGRRIFVWYSPREVAVNCRHLPARPGATGYNGR